MIDSHQEGTRAHRSRARPWETMMLPKPLANAIIVLVSVAFAINFGASFFIPEYRSDPYIYGIFMTVVGGSFALSRKEDAGGADKGPPRERVSTGGDQP